jgi:WD40 repeat protein
MLLWDIEEASIVAQMYDRQGRVLRLAFSPDGKILAASLDNFYLTVWDVANRQPLTRPIFRHTASVNSLAFSKDGKMLASAGNEIVLLDMSPESWIKKACNLASRNLTQNEWQQYFPGETYRATCPEWPEGK